MTFSDYLIDSVLLLIVLLQVRETRLDRRMILMPLGIAGWVGSSYLHTIPTAGNDLPLILGFTAVGVTLGVCSGLTTRVRTNGGRHALIQAGAAAAGLWVLGMGFRFGFAVWASHGGSAALGRFSVEHSISGSDAWTAALVLMALGEVVSRTAVLVARSLRALAAQNDTAQNDTVHTDTVHTDTGFATV